MWWFKKPYFRVIVRTKAIVTDIDGTVISLSKGVGECYAELLGELGYPIDAQILTECSRAVWNEFQPEYLNTANQHRTDSVRERDVWHSFVRRVLDVAGHPCAANPEVISIIYDAFSTERFRVVEAGVEKFLSTARAKGVKLFAATNNDLRSKAVLARLNLDSLFDGIFVAGELAWKKPSPQYFAALCHKTGFDANAMVHIGNDPLFDREAAIACGWRAVLYDPKGRHQAPRFGHFDELMNVLKL